jgi:hypothetical protein
MRAAHEARLQPNGDATGGLCAAGRLAGCAARPASATTMVSPHAERCRATRCYVRRCDAVNGRRQALLPVRTPSSRLDPDAAKRGRGQRRLDCCGSSLGIVARVGHKRRGAGNAQRPVRASDDEALALTVAAVETLLGSPDVLGHADGYNSVGLAIIDAVWSIGVRYQGVRDVIARYRAEWIASGHDPDVDSPADVRHFIEALRRSRCVRGPDGQSSADLVAQRHPQGRGRAARGAHRERGRRHDRRSGRRHRRALDHLRRRSSSVTGQSSGVPLARLLPARRPGRRQARPHGPPVRCGRAWTIRRERRRCRLAAPGRPAHRCTPEPRGPMPAGQRRVGDPYHHRAIAPQSMLAHPKNSRLLRTKRSHDR